MPAVEQPDDALADFAASQRTQRRKRLAAVCTSLALLGVAWAWWRSGQLPAFDEASARAAERSMDRLSTAAPEQHAQLAASALAQLEQERLPPAMLGVYAELEHTEPARAGALMLAPFERDADARHAWEVACTAGHATLASYADTRDIDALFADCGLGRWSLIDGTAARRRSAGRLVLAHATWAWLVDHHSETELERRLLRVFVQGSLP